MAYTMARRTNEIGLRMALGASAGGVARMVVAESVRTVTAGALAGVPLAWAATILVRANLFGVDAADPTSIAIALGALAVVALAAAAIPALRAARVDPAEALRSN
jgi:ABC-type antimicrobial peptide transport system permease subunit